MIVYILTEEPYHDNSTILGVFDNEQDGLEALDGSVDPSEINGSDTTLTEWDLDKNEGQRQWCMVGKQITDPSRKDWWPIRRDYTLIKYVPEER